MKKTIFKSIVSALLAAAMCAGLVCSSVSASETDVSDDGEHIYEVLTDDMSDLARGETAPKYFHNLGGNNDYTASFDDLGPQRVLYTNYYFATATGNIYANVHAERSGTTTNRNRLLQMELYERDPETSVDELVQTAVAPFTGTEYSGRYQFTGYDPHKFYYFLFKNTSSTNPSSRMDISATIVIDEV